MLQIRNNAVISTPLAIPSAGAAVPFDTTVYNTNSATKLNSNTVQIYTPGMYDTTAQVVLKNAATSAVTATLELLGNGQAIPGASATITIAASGTAPVELPRVVEVKPADSGVASLSWRVSGADVSLANASAIIWRMP